MVLVHISKILTKTELGTSDWSMAVIGLTFVWKNGDFDFLIDECAGR